MSDEKIKTLVTNRIGAVTFLDVLGWKGIWQRKNDAVEDLQGLARLIDKIANEQSRGKGTGMTASTNDTRTRVLIISDTLVISTEANTEDAQDALELHGKLCEKAIPESIVRGIPVRGATSFGEFLIDDNESILVGKAIDEAASWHETADWIGVFMSPSAAYLFDISKSTSWIEYDPPLKNALKLRTCAVKWFHPANDPMGEFLLLKKHFALMSPIVPEFASKFQNTIQYIDKQISIHTTNTNGA